MPGFVYHWTADGTAVWTHRWVPMSICFIGEGVKFRHLFPAWMDEKIRHTAFFSVLVSVSVYHFEVAVAVCRRLDKANLLMVWGGGGLDLLCVAHLKPRVLTVMLISGGYFCQIICLLFPWITWTNKMSSWRWALFLPPVSGGKWVKASRGRGWGWGQQGRHPLLANMFCSIHNFPWGSTCCCPISVSQKSLSCHCAAAVSYSCVILSWLHPSLTKRNNLSPLPACVKVGSFFSIILIMINKTFTHFVTAERQKNVGTDVEKWDLSRSN